MRFEAVTTVKGQMLPSGFVCCVILELLPDVSDGHTV
jgi:hypothetical protein